MLTRQILKMSYTKKPHIIIIQMISDERKICWSMLKLKWNDIKFVCISMMHVNETCTSDMEHSKDYAPPLYIILENIIGIWPKITFFKFNNNLLYKLFVINVLIFLYNFNLIMIWYEMSIQNVLYFFIKYKINILVLSI